MELSSKLLLQALVIQLFYLTLTTYALQFYVTTPDVFSRLGLSVSNGTKQFPFTSVASTIYSATEGTPHQIFLSPHDHYLDCLTCNSCSNQCEILRGGGISNSYKEITIATYLDCLKEFNQVMCLNQKQSSTLIVKKTDIKLNLNKDILTFKNLTISGEQLITKIICNQPNCTQYSYNYFIRIIHSNLILYNVVFKNFSIEPACYIYSEQSILEVNNSVIFNNKPNTNGTLIYANQSLVTIRETNFTENKGNLINAIWSNITVNNSSFMKNIAA